MHSAYICPRIAVWVCWNSQLCYSVVVGVVGECCACVQSLCGCVAHTPSSGDLGVLPVEQWPGAGNFPQVVEIPL